MSVIETAARGWSKGVRLKVLPLGERLWADAKTPTLRQRELFGGEIVLDVSRSNVQRQLYLEGERFVPEAALVAALVKPGSSAIDVGANIGYYTLALHRAGASPIVCLEPEPDNLVELDRTLEANHFTDVHVIAAAAGATNGHTRFQSGLNGFVADDGDQEVRLITIDSAAQSHVGLIKVDVEGFERQVLEGARGVIKRDRPNLFVEIHPARMVAEDDIEQILAQVRTCYADVSMYGNPRRSRGLTRVVDRFRPVVLPEITNWDDRPFWLVARS